MDNYVLKDPPQTLWCKKGYFVQFNKTLQIGLNDLDETGIDAKITDLEVNDDNLINPNLHISNGSHVEIFSKDRNLKYMISLDYIGNAGINPFKKAAYITVSTYGLVKNNN